ncbi:uncharacterized protein METZ01_LOCUS45623 [marine metagenome]|uniref:Uncharacterized protein n=1 Tax=marine metagenome TaxID=408172 RepID=A0A381RNZ6_9ZZZZ
MLKTAVLEFTMMTIEEQEDRGICL